MAITMLVSFIVAAGFTYTDVLLADRVQRGSIEVLFLASEMNREVGPDFVKAKKMHAEFLRAYVPRMESRVPKPLSFLLGDQYSPRVQLAKSLGILETSQQDNESCSNAIKLAATKLSEAGKVWSS